MSGRPSMDTSHESSPLRLRTSSSGSTRDVFYHGKDVPKRAVAPTRAELVSLRRRRKKKKDSADEYSAEVAPLPFTEPRGLKPETLSPLTTAQSSRHPFRSSGREDNWGDSSNGKTNPDYGRPLQFAHPVAYGTTSDTYFDGSASNIMNNQNHSLRYSNDPDWLAAVRGGNGSSLFGLGVGDGFASKDGFNLSSFDHEDDGDDDSTQATTNTSFSMHVPQPLLALLEHYFYDPNSPEFSSLQQFNWSIILGFVMGVYCAFWKAVIEGGVDFFWEDFPKYLLDLGVFNEQFPLFHYMWIWPALAGCVLSYVVATYDFPDQNEWISSLHSRGVQDHSSFFALFVLSTVGMWSGLSLGPELPLVLTSGMVGSWLALVTKQSMLQARVLNITAASAAIGGFFGFPLAGALFVLELPHRMGLQYFEAISPAVVASIVAVVTKAQITGEEVAGYFRYPFLSPSLPSSIYYIAIIIGFYGCAVGLAYAYMTKYLKVKVHDWFHAVSHDHKHAQPETSGLVPEGVDEQAPLLSPNKGTAHKRTTPEMERSGMWDTFAIANEPKRAAVAGALAGAMVGWIGIFLPHVLFWGEAQLQNLIDKGRTELPVFGESGNVAASSMIRHAICMVDEEEGFGIGCSVLIAFAKTIVIGLSLGTGIVGGHFWGPLYVGCAASHFLVDIVDFAHRHFGTTKFLVAYPCMVILGTMGAAHVVSFRAPFGIILILALTISTFDDSSSGDFAAVVPYLVFAVKIALMTSRDLVVFYPTQRERGDINPVPELLCQPGMEGAPLIVRYDSVSVALSTDYTSTGNDMDSKLDEECDIEMANSDSSTRTRELVRNVMDLIKESDDAVNAPLKNTNDSFIGQEKLDSDRLDELLGISHTENPPSTVPNQSRHRRTRSAPMVAQKIPPRTFVAGKASFELRTRPDTPANRERTNSSSSQKGSLVRINSFGDIQEHQPSLLDQARLRSASTASSSQHRRTPSLPRMKRPPGSTGKHSRKPSDASQRSLLGYTGEVAEGGALSMDDLEYSFSELIG